MTTTSNPLPINAIPIERFVERLYAPLAWEATVRLGDPAIASRLVERVLHRAWEERERFATFETLYRHAQDAAVAAIEREADRRRDVTRFDGDTHHGPIPGSLDAMSVDAVRKRIGEGRKPLTTPPAVLAVTAAPVAPTQAPAPAPVPAQSVAPTQAAAPAPEPRASRPAHKPRLSMGAMRVDAQRAPAARPSGAMHRASGAQARTSNAHPRLAGGIDPFADKPSLLSRLDPEQRKMAIGGAVLVVAAAVILALRGGSGGDPQERAFAALADTTGATHATSHGKSETVPLPDSSRAVLGADASIRLNPAFGDGARAFRIAGPVSFSLKNDSSALVAIQAGEHRFLTAGGVAAFNTDGAGLLYVQVDSGEVVLVRDSSRVRLVEGSVVRVGSGTPMPLTRYQRNAMFGWRQGRLQLSGATLREIASSTRQWYDTELRWPSDREATDTASVDVPLASRDSLAAALESALSLRADLLPDRITLRAGASAAPQARRSAAGPVQRAPQIAPLPALSMPAMPPLG